MQANPRVLNEGELGFPNEPIPLSEIEQLEQLYNNGVPFPKALRELLFLAGDYCNVLDYGPTDSQQELQDFFREELADVSIVLPNPFFALERHSGGEYSWVYLNQGDNPIIYMGDPHWIEFKPDWSRSINKTIPEYVNAAIDRLKSGLPLF